MKRTLPEHKKRSMKRLRLIKNQNGGINIIGVLLLLILVATIYLVVQFAPIYLERFKVQQVLNTLARRGQSVKKHIVEKELIGHIQRSGIKVSPEDFDIIEENGEIFVFIYYEREVDHPFGYVTLLEFDLEGTP